VKTEGSKIDVEGCLSIPGKRGTVERPTKVVVNALNRKGKAIQVTGEGLLAVALCHELDHLDGILYTDKMIEDVTDKEDKNQ
jgi:peptide deformylase